MTTRNSVGFLLSALGGLLGALLIVILLIQTHSEWQTFRATADAAEVNAASDALLVAVERMTLERGLTNSALNADAAAGASAVEAIVARRQEMRSAFASAWPVLKSLHRENA